MKIFTIITFIMTFMITMTTWMTIWAMTFGMRNFRVMETSAYGWENINKEKSV